MDKIEKLQQLNEVFALKITSPLLKTCNTIVPGAGNADADIMFIGEAPGKKEDELGLPFVGAAGKFLDQMLEAIGLTRNDVYITNIVKCFGIIVIIVDDCGMFPDFQSFIFIS